MPPASTARDGNLRIDLNNPKVSYVASEILTGYNVLDSLPKDLHRPLNLMLLGRAESKVRISDGKYKKEYRGAAILFLHK